MKIKVSSNLHQDDLSLKNNQHKEDHLRNLHGFPQWGTMESKQCTHWQEIWEGRTRKETSVGGDNEWIMEL